LYSSLILKDTDAGLQKRFLCLPKSDDQSHKFQSGRGVFGSTPITIESNRTDMIGAPFFLYFSGYRYGSFVSWIGLGFLWELALPKHNPPHNVFCHSSFAGSDRRFGSSADARWVGYGGDFSGSF
jgi:hypothetical protein